MSMQNGEVSPEMVQAAMQRYRGLPAPLAITKYMLDEQMEKQQLGPLMPGMGWGGVHLETVGILVQKLADALYHQFKKSITITIQATDYPDSYDHFWVEVKEVESGTATEMGHQPIAGWPCCACGEDIRGDDPDSTVMLLTKRATWETPSWGNVLDGTWGRAIAALCGECAKADKKPAYAIRRVENAEDSTWFHFERVPLDELEDLDGGDTDAAQEQ